MYGSSLTIATLRPRASRIAPSEAAAMPLPSEETTPPVTQMNLVIGATVVEIARRESSLVDRGVVWPVASEHVALGHRRPAVPADAPRRLVRLRRELRGAGNVGDCDELARDAEQRQ